MTSLSPWLRPTLLGPLATLWTIATLGSLLMGMATLSGGRIDGWLIGMLWASFFGCTLSVLLISADLVLLRAKLRRLPQGAPAWVSSVLAPLAVFFVWQLPFIPPPESAPGLVAFLALPMVLSAFAVRFVFGSRP